MIENTISINGTEFSDNVLAEAMSETKVQENNCLPQEENFGSEESFSEKTDENSPAEATADNMADQPEETVELTVYGEKRKVPLSQAVIAAQKGMAFEHLKAELADSRNDYRLTAIEELAKHSGMTSYQLLAQLQHKTIEADLIGRYGSLNAVPLEELGQAINTIMAGRRLLEEGRTTMEYNHWKNQIREFMEANPGCTEIPPEVIEAAKKGENLSLAYGRIYGNRLTKEIEEAKRELDILKSENKALKNSTPSAKSVGGNDKPKENEFLKLMKSTW